MHQQHSPLLLLPFTAAYEMEVLGPSMARVSATVTMRPPPYSNVTAAAAAGEDVPPPPLPSPSAEAVRRRMWDKLHACSLRLFFGDVSGAAAAAAAAAAVFAAGAAAWGD
jgi:hypothetical protein